MKTTTVQPISAFTKQNLPVIREAINAALKGVADQFGLDAFELGTMGFDRQGTNFRVQLSGHVKAEFSPALIAKQENDSKVLGYDRNIVGLTFTVKGEKFKVVGFNFNRPKMPIECVKVSDNRPYKFGAKGKLPLDDLSVGYDRAANLFATQL
jgi:hypothetical protein